VNIGENSYIAAGSVITKNVPKNYFSISRSKQKNIKNFKK
jgi:bifunctional UDP-N-acetylglucosamine pyrophosphorylase/glucosamine-1-phosphate N-acetyltransferase